jgi:hypothetical protein
MRRTESSSTARVTVCLGTTQWRFRFTRRANGSTPKRSSDGGQMSAGAFWPNSRSYEASVLVYQSSNFAPSLLPPLVGWWWSGR